MRLLSLALLGAFALAFPVTASADPSPAPTASPSLSPAVATALQIATSRLDTMLKTGHADPAWFTKSFLDQVPAGKVDEIVAQLKSTLGAYKSIEFTPNGFIAHFEKGTDIILIHLDATNTIDGLFFKPPTT